MSLSSDNMTVAQVNVDGRDVDFGDWWHWLLLVLLVVMLAAASAIVGRCVLLRWRRAEKSEDEVVPFNKAVLPESDDEHPVAALDDSSPLGTKVAPVAGQDSLRVADRDSRAPAPDVQLVESPTTSAVLRPAAPADVSPAVPVPAAARPPDVQAQPDALETPRVAATPLVLALPAPVLGHKRFDQHLREEASQLLRAALEGDSMDLLQTAIARAKVAGVPEEEVWFAEVCRRRRIAVEELVFLLGDRPGPTLAPQWRRLWAKKAPAMRELLMRAKMDPQAVLKDLRLAAEDACEQWHDAQHVLSG